MERMEYNKIEIKVQTHHCSSFFVRNNINAYILYCVL